jgi:hypothetical protein
MQCPLCGHDGVPRDARFCPYCEKLLLRPRPAIGFSRHIAEHTRDFTGREWVFQAVANWLGDPAGSRILLVTGKAGSGKTALAARLVQFSTGEVAPSQGGPRLRPGFLDAYHFCAAQRPDWINPNKFAESLSIQLSRHPECASALVAQADRRRDRGEFPIQVVHQTARQIRDDGQMVGFVNIIQHLDAGDAAPEDAFMRLIKDPLAAYLEAHPAEQAIILVDALDEALRYSGKMSIVAMLAWADCLPLGVRFVLTTRPETAILQAVRAVGFEELPLTAREGLAHTLKDVEQYIRHAVQHRPTLADLLAPDFTQQEFAREVQEKTQGNFLRARRLLDELVVRATTIQPKDLEALPGDLAADYLDSLRRLTDGDLNTWEEKQEPVLGTLAVAQRALREHELAGIVGRYRSQVRRVLTTLLPYLDRDESVPASQRLYSIKEYAFASFLLDEDKPEEYWCEEQVQHRRIADHLKGFADDWAQCETYSLEYAAYHLIQAGQAEDLNLILTKSFSDASSQRLRWHMPFVRNLEQALDVIEPERAARLCLDILYGRRPNSLVNQRIVYLLTDTIRPALQRKGSPFGDPESRRDRMIDQALGLLSSKPSKVTELARLFERARGPVRGVISLALGATKSQEATAVLLKALQEEKGRTAWCVADALLDIDDRTVIPCLMELSDDPSAKSGLQQRILYVLGRMRATEARGLIEKGLEHRSVYAKAHAVNMLYLLAPVDGAEDILWEKLGFSDKGPEHDSEPVWKSEYLQHRMVTALGRVGTGRSIDHLLRFRRETLPDRAPPDTDTQKRERQRLEQSLDRAIRKLQGRNPGSALDSRGA